jgi:hypothetical protein
MYKAYQYIKRLLVFSLCFIAQLLTFNYLSVYITLPILLLAFSILHSRITDEKPPHLFAFFRTDAYFKKGGLRDLIRIFVTLFGFLYDTVIWTVWGIYLVFILFIDLLDLIKSVFYWILHAILWYLRQYVPFVIFLYKILIHYMVRWPWWLYQIAYFNIRCAYNRNSCRIAFWGTLQAAFIVFLFYYLELMLVDIPGITYIGLIIALLPLTWSFGEIAGIRVQKFEKEPYRSVKSKFQNGIEAVRSILFYITLFVVLLLAQLGLNLLGWIPQSGVPIAGFVFNINTFISLILLFVCILIILGVMIIPSYRLYIPFSEIRLSHTMDLLKTMGKKVLQYIFISLPAAVFSAFVLIIPFAVILLVGILTYNLKNGMIDIKINNLRTEQATTADQNVAYGIGKRIEQLKYLQQFPLHLSQEIEHRKNLINEQAFARDDLKSMNEELLKDTEDFEKRIDNLQKEIDQRKNRNASDIMLEPLTIEKSQLQNELASRQQSKQVEIAKLRIDIDSLIQRRKQIPLLFFFGGLWLVIFGSMVIAFYISYLGNIFYQVYIFRNDAEQSRWTQVINEIRSKDQKQPLLGGTLFIITLFLIYLLVSRIKIIAAVIMFLTTLLSYGT